MCGIIAILGIPNCQKKLLKGLYQLQNRGYDSAGICTLNSEFINYKYASDEKVSALQKIELILDEYNNSNIGIGHTRWATHGPKTDENSHPHISSDNKFSVVHNGIIENYKTLKNMLIKNGFTFNSETDTEVISNLLEFEYKKCKNVNNSIKNTINQLQGTWGLAILCSDTPNKLYCTRHGSPLIFNYTDKYFIVTSEQSGFCGEENKYIVLDNYDICEVIYKNDIINVNTNKDYEFLVTNNYYESMTPEPYLHWTLKEINEQVDSIERVISLGGRLINDEEVKLGGLEDNKKRLLFLENIILLGCGTSYYSGLLGINYFKELCNFNTVQLFDGADFTIKDVPKFGKTGLILLSQSGETKDLHRCIKIGKENDLFLIGVVNVVDSMIAREVDCGCYLNAGREVGVASTKSFTSQVIILSMIAIWFAQKKNINLNKRINIIRNLRNLSFDVQTILNRYETKILDFIPLLNYNSCFILGKYKGEAIAKEGSLKIKEISYIHAEGYSASSLKHGPFALLEENFPVILLSLNKKHYHKIESVYEEIKSRKASIIFITNDPNSKKENTILLPKNESYSDLLGIIPIQLMAYHLSISKGINPDMPKNLAKVVTVE